MAHLLNAEEFRGLLTQKIEEDGRGVIVWYREGIIDTAREIRREYSGILRRQGMSDYVKRLRVCVEASNNLKGKVRDIEQGRVGCIPETVEALVSLHSELAGIEHELEEIAQ